MTARSQAELLHQRQVNHRFLRWAHGDLELGLSQGLDLGLALAEGVDLDMFMPMACLREIESSLKLKYLVTCALYPLQSLGGNNEFAREQDVAPWEHVTQRVLNETGGRVHIALVPFAAMRILGMLPSDSTRYLRAAMGHRIEPPSGEDPVVAHDRSGRPVGLLELRLLSGASVPMLSEIVSQFGLGRDELGLVVERAQARIRFNDVDRSFKRSLRQQISQRLAVKPGAEEASTLAEVAKGFAFLAGLGAPLDQTLWERALASINAGHAKRSPDLSSLPQLVSAQSVGVLEVGGSGRRNIALRGLIAQDFPTDEVLHFACTTLDEDLVRLSLSKGADPTAKNRAGLTPLEALVAATDKRHSSIRVLLHAAIARQEANAAIAQMTQSLGQSFNATDEELDSVASPVNTQSRALGLR